MDSIDLILNNYSLCLGKPLNVILVITDNCNFKCRYCFVKQQPKDMSLETGKRVVDWLFENWKLQQGIAPITITFFGGEPLLRWESFIVPIVEYGVTVCGKENIRFSITTNGSLFDEIKLLFCQQHNINITLSIDGDKITQSYNRLVKGSKENSFSIVEKNIPLIVDKIPTTMVRPTLYVDTVEHTFENYLFFIKSGFKYVHFGIDRTNLWSVEKQKILTEQINKICYYGLTHLEYFYVFQNLIKILKELQYKDGYLSQCGLGLKTVGVATDGTIISCQELGSLLDEHDTIFRLGNIHSDIKIDPQIHHALLKKFIEEGDWVCEDREYCKKCIISKRLCNKFGCVGFSRRMEDSIDNLYIKNYIDCYYENLIYRNAFLINNILSSQNISLDDIKNIFN